MTGVRGYSLTGRLGSIRAANTDYECIPTHPNEGGYGALCLHQAGSLYLAQFASSTTPVSSELPPSLARAGIPSIAGALNGSVGGDGFANPSSLVDVEAARVRNGVLNPKINSAKVHLVSFSMGAFVALSYALANPSKVASITTVVGLTDIMSAYDSTPAQQGPMQTAWAVANRAALAASAAGAVYGRLGELAGIPTRLYYSTADTTILAATQTGAAAAIGSSATAISVSSSLNHAAAEQIAGIVRDRGDGQWSEITNFMRSHDPA